MEEKRKSVTLYLSEHVIDLIDTFGAATKRSKSQAAEFLVEHGAANYDVKFAAPQKVATPKKATKANTKMKKVVPAKLPANVKRAAAKAVADKTVQSRGRPKATATKKPATSRRRKASEPAKKQAA